MLFFEKKIVDFVCKKKWLLLGIATTILALGIRYIGRKFISGDAVYFLIPWFDIIKENGGIASLRMQVGDYNIPYQLFIALATYIPNLSQMTLIKMLSIVFDFVLAISSGFLAAELGDKKNRKIRFIVTYATILMLPTVIFDSAYWGQCDSIYVSFIVLALYLVKKQKVIPAFIFLGLAFAFKLQFIFIVPFFFYIYFAKKNYSILNYFIIIIVNYIVCLPGFFLGRSVLAPLAIYFNQSNQYKNMTMNFPNVWGIFGNNNYEYLKLFGIIFVIFLLGGGLVFVLHYNVDIISYKFFLPIACWTVWTAVMFLPGMHERYAYLLEILLVILTVCQRRYAMITLVALFVSLNAYSYYLFGNMYPMYWIGSLYLADYVIFSGMLYKILTKTDRRNL